MNIKEIRVLKNMTQAEVASALGVSSVVYSRYETGTRQPSIELLIQLADIFNVSMDLLIGRKDISTLALTDYENQLLDASRRADKRAREDALNTLLAHPAE